MATKDNSTTAGKTAWFLVLIAFVSSIALVDYWSASDTWGSRVASMIISSGMIILGAAVCIVAFGEIWLTGYYRSWAVLRELYMTALVGMGVTSAAWLWMQHHGIFYTVFCGTIVCDTAAQMCGRLWPRVTIRWPRVYAFGSVHPRILKNVSGGKTRGGFVCGMGLAAIFMAVCIAIESRYFDVQIAVWWLVVLVPLGAVIGDLSASWVKRGMGADDFYLMNDEEGILGSHGGLLDRIDSHLCAQFFAAMALLLS